MAHLTLEHAPMTYHVMTSSAKMPQSCWGRYGNVAVLEVRPGGRLPRLIRTTRTVRVVWYRGRLSCGKTARSAFEVARREAAAFARNANAVEQAWASIGGDVY